MTNGDTGKPPRPLPQESHVLSNCPLIMIIKQTNLENILLSLKKNATGCIKQL